MTMPPQRKRELPDNLYQNVDKRDGVTYFRYKNPVTKRFRGFGTDKEAAIKDANALNYYFAAEQAGARVAKVSTPKPDGIRLSKIILVHLERCEELRKRDRMAANTLRLKSNICSTLTKRFAGQSIDAVSVRDIAEFLQTYIDQGKERMAQAVRSEFIEVYKTAIAEGFTNGNTAAKTRTVDARVTRDRLTLETFLPIYEAAKAYEPWVARSMELAILTAQRREDISNIEFKPRKGAAAWVEGDSLYVIQSKTGMPVAIDLTIRLNVLDMTLSDVIARCRDSTVSRYLVHHRANCGPMKAGDQVWVDTISKNFAKARKLSGYVTPEGKTPASFHEMRSLSERLHDDQGSIDTQKLLGHKDKRSTAIYKDTRGAEWVRVSM
jgi:integrase